jgi:hypothetical protein
LETLIFLVKFQPGFAHYESQRKAYYIASN